MGNCGVCLNAFDSSNSAIHGRDNSGGERSAQSAQSAAYGVHCFTGPYRAVRELQVFSPCNIDFQYGEIIEITEIHNALYVIASAVLRLHRHGNAALNHMVIGDNCPLIVNKETAACRTPAVKTRYIHRNSTSLNKFRQIRRRFKRRRRGGYGLCRRRRGPSGRGCIIAAGTGRARFDPLSGVVGVVDAAVDVTGSQQDHAHHNAQSHEYAPQNRFVHILPSLPYIDTQDLLLN